MVFFSRWVLGTVFIVAGMEKIMNPEAFASSVDAYQLLPVSMINIFAITVPWIEMICGLFLVGGIFIRSSALLTSLLLFVFIIAIFSAIARNLHIDCGCFGSSHDTPVGWLKVLQDLGLFLLGAHIVWFPRSAFALENLATQHN